MKEFEALGHLRAVRRVDSGVLGDVAVEGEVDVDRREVTLRLEIDKCFPLKLPAWFLQPWDALGVIPHVDGRGFVCFADPEGLVLDRRRPVAIISESLQRVTKVLADGVNERNRGDFVDELEAYWERIPEIESMTSMLDTDGDVRAIRVAVDHERKVSLVCSTPADIVDFCNGRSLGTKVTLRNALYVPLEQDSVVVPPPIGGPMWSAADARREITSGLSRQNQERLRKLTKKRSNGIEYVLIAVPQPSGGTALVGIKYEGVGQRHPLLDGGTADRLVPLKFARRERTYLVPRGGADISLGGKRVLLVGGGAVGGHLTFELVRAGVLDLTVVDPDKLTADNSFRHVLGRRYWAREKADALKEEIEAQLPYVRVSSVVDTIEGALSTGTIELCSYDLVVVAIGNPTVELDVNERLNSLGAGPSGLFAWLEPLGIGGHALLTAYGATPGCFECLYTAASDSIAGLVNRAAFAAPEQSFGRALSGCGSLHSPFGSVDAIQTAAMAARLAIAALKRTEKGRPLISWRGDDSAFVAAGFRLSDRYMATLDQLEEQRYTYASPICPVCGDGP